MQTFEFRQSSLRARMAGAVFAVVASLSSLAAVFAVFATASGELDPVQAKVKVEAAASAVAGKAPAARPGPPRRERQAITRVARGASG